MSTKTSKQKGRFISIATKVSAADWLKVNIVAEQLNMTMYEMLQSLILSLLRYFDKDSPLSDKGKDLIESFIQVINAHGHGSRILKDGFSLSDVKGAIVFIKKKGEQHPQTIAFEKDLMSGWMKKYNTDDMLAKFLQSTDSETLQTLENERDKIGHFSLARTLHHIVLQYASQHDMQPAETIEDEIKTMFDDACRVCNKSLEYGERTRRKKHYDPDTLASQPWMQSNQSDDQDSYDEDSDDIEGFTIVDASKKKTTHGERSLYQVNITQDIKEELVKS